MYSAFIMFSQKMTLWASTVWPFDHFQPFRLMVTVLPPFDQTGAAASERGKLTVGADEVTCPKK